MNNTTVSMTTKNQDLGTVATVMVSLQLIIMILIVGGNMLVVLAYNKFRHLQTVTGKFVLNLAVSDLVLGLSIPFQIAFFFNPDMERIKNFCLLRFQTVMFTSTASLVSLLCTVMDRFVAILMPLRYHSIMSNKVAYVLIALSWLYSAILNSVPFFGYNTWNMAPFCLFELVMTGEYRFTMAMHTILLSFVMFVIYVKIFYVAWSHRKKIRAEEIVMHNASQVQRDSKMAQVMALVVLSFTLAWLPFCIIQMAQVLSFSVNKAIAGNFAVFLGIFNSTTNPVIYAWKNKDYRKAFRQVLCCRSSASQEDLEVNNTVHTNIPSYNEHM